MLLKLLNPKPRLLPYIDKFWLFESSCGLPSGDSRVIVPNGRVKIIYPYINSLSTFDGRVQNDHQELDVFVVGLWTEPVVLSSKSQITGTIGIELSPAGAYRFTRLPLSDLKGRVVSLRDIYGSRADGLTDKLANADGHQRKADLLQDFLIEVLEETLRENLIVDYTVAQIQKARGAIEIRTLEKLTGYSKRYLDLLFQDHLGISPKNLAGILRFQELYKAWAVERHMRFYGEKALELYYDHSHFAKDFKRFTGSSPREYASERNEFGRIFYITERS